ncbi:hypothetical protein CAPTEDRAFT_224010 [Capitella teleta]|uniref:Major facilitator superfamily (MFS) profile domain-containing protein n=1 Tax=Capitella teleta TaxID=283909 RepID=R7V914_CAPTE|nr:hypothetical protein CAPTEDRAFT_224010 [Capitella teleta]|eukprot:ELU15338.1 hypothetical protein CAPTEDRAFT_224010 [Capitella teleta]
MNTDRLRKTYLKNLLILSLSVMFVYAPFYALRNLQSSINHENGLGLISMALMGVTYILGCLLGTGLVNRIRPKWALLFGLSGFLVYILANFHATFFTLLPATLLVGFTNANLWVAQGTYLTSIGISYAALTAKRHDHVLMLFNGTFVFFLQFSQFLGNLVCSMILGMDFSSSTDDHLDLPEAILSTDWNTSFCGSSYCHSYLIEHASYSINAITLAVLLGIFSALCICGMSLLGFFLDKLDVIFHKSKVKVLGQILRVAHLHRHRSMLLAIPGYVFLGAQAAFVYGDFTKAFITCPFGVHMVGYVMMFFGICDSITAFINGPVQQMCGRRSVLFAMAVFHLSLLVILYLWKPRPDEHILIFLLAGALGMCDATWQTQTCTMTGLMFKEREAAFASFRIYESLGFTVAAGVAQFICIDVKIVLLAVTLVLSMASNAVLEFSVVADQSDIAAVTV